MSDLPLLPSDRYVASLLGLTESQYRFYQAEVRRCAAAQPRPAVVAEPTTATLATISLVSSIISIGLTIAASFFKPKQQQAPQLRQTQTQGGTISNVRKFVPRQGFDSVQDVATIGEVVPLVYANRELINGEYYGGIRINASLIWSQITAIDKSQILRAMFLISEGAEGLEIDPANIAIGNNTLGSYLLGNAENSRFTVYFRPYGGRIIASDRILGATNDPGSLLDTDVYAVLDENDNPASWFCHAHRPNTQTQFGVYSLIGNGFGFRVNPSLRPGVNAQISVKVKGGKNAKAEGRVVCEPDYVSLAQREKFKAKFSGRSGLISQVGDTWTYHLSNTSDAETLFEAGQNFADWSTRVEVDTNPFLGITSTGIALWLQMGPVISEGSSLSSEATLNTASVETALANRDDGNYIIVYGVYFVRGSKDIFAEHIVTISRTTSTVTGIPVSSYSYTNSVATITVSVNDRLEVHQERCGDVAAAVAGRQKGWDDTLQVGELLKVGSALTIISERNPSDQAFNSDADFEPVTPSQGSAVDVTLQVVRAGSTQTVSLSDLQKDALDDPPFKTATNFPHLYRIAIANFSTLRECRIVEVCMRSSLGIRIGGLCNFRDTLTYEQIDDRACLDKENNKIAPGDYLTVDIFSSGQMNSSEERFSFFRVRYRESGTNATFIELSPCFGVRGNTQQNVFNDIRLVMPSVKRWEFQIEPLSGWEIRSGTAAGDLELIDSGLTTKRTITGNGVTVSFRGVVTAAGPFIPAASRSSQGPEKFRMASVQRGGNGEIGIGYSDGSSYLDSWGRLAEAFVYEEVRSSAESSPEHEIVNVNEIIPNAVPPQYERLAILGFNVRSGPEFEQFGQLSVQATKALGNGTHLLPELLQDVMTNIDYGRGDQISTELIHAASFEASSVWCRDRLMFHDGAITGRINLRQWAADAAAAHLLLFGESGGKFWLRPAWPGTVSNPLPVQVQGLFTAGNISEDSFSLEYLPPEDRRPIQVSVRYREERQSSNLDNPGVFPVELEVLVREAAPHGSDMDPIESLDLSDYVTSREHAIDAAKYVARMRRIPDHAIRFETTHEGLVSTIQPGDFIRVAMDIINVNEFRNGAVLGNGSLVSTQPFEDGTYQVFAWDGSSNSVPTASALSVSGNGSTASPTGIIFTVINEATQTSTYQIEKITPTDDGRFSVEAVHMPTTDTGILVMADGFDQASNWVIT